MGLIAGLALIVIGITGSLLVFAEELETLFNSKFMRVEAVRSKRLPMDELFRSVNRQLPGYEVAGWLMRDDGSDIADLLYILPHGSGQWKVGTVNQYTGEVIASPRTGRATITGFLLDLHYNFFADHAGMLITGVVAVLLCALGITGFWLYRDFWRNFFRLRLRASARILFSDLHKMVGISSVVFNLILGFTGAYWNFVHVIGEWVQGEHVQPKMEKRLYAESISLVAILAEGPKHIAGFRPTYIGLPIEPKGAITLWGKAESRNPLRGSYGCTVSFDPLSGKFTEKRDVRELGWWAQFVDMFEPLHYGNFGGIPFKVIWCLGGLTPGILAISGSIIWWKRTRKRRKKNSGGSEGSNPNNEGEAAPMIIQPGEDLRLARVPQRCLFRNECVAIRLLGLPEREDIGACLACRVGMLMVTQGEVIAESSNKAVVLREGDSIQLPVPNGLRLVACDGADMLVFERLNSVSGGASL